MALKVAVVGATGTVGREILSVLAERQFPAGEVVALASEKSVGAAVSYGESAELNVQDITRFDFTGTDLVFFAAGAAISAKYVPKAAQAGAWVVDDTGAFRADSQVPLVIPEINAGLLTAASKRKIVANPGALAIQVAMVLKPLHEEAAVQRVVASAYQAVSGAGKEAMEELFRQTRGVYVNDVPQKEHFTKQIAFNVIPHVGGFMDDGQTDEEWAFAVDMKKVLGAGVKATITCVYVPVFIGDGLALNVVFEKPLDAAQARRLLRKMPGVTVIDHRADEGYATPVEAAGDDSVFVSRIREDATVDNGLNMWIVGDNIRKGAALNVVQIAEALFKNKP